jgi:hypothetical protein
MVVSFFSYSLFEKGFALKGLDILAQGNALSIYTHKMVLRVRRVLSLEAERLCHTLQSMKLGSAKFPMELVSEEFARQLTMGGKRDRHPPRLGLETILSYSESSRGIILPRCHLPNSHEQFFARLDRWLV